MINKYSRRLENGRTGSTGGNNGPLVQNVNSARIQRMDPFIELTFYFYLHHAISS